MNKVYLGDSVYAQFDPTTNAIILTTENGYGPTNTIVLEQEVCDMLITFIEKVENLE